MQAALFYMFGVLLAEMPYFFTYIHTKRRYVYKVRNGSTAMDGGMK